VDEGGRRQDGFYKGFAGKVICEREYRRYSDGTAVLDAHGKQQIDKDRTCVCHGGNLDPCSGCSSITIKLNDDDGSYVPLEKCPYNTDWAQEAFLVADFGHYQNRHLRWPIEDWPLWYAIAMGQLSKITNAEQESQNKEGRS